MGRCQGLQQGGQLLGVLGGEHTVLAQAHAADAAGTQGLLYQAALAVGTHQQGDVARLQGAVPDGHRAGVRRFNRSAMYPAQAWAASVRAASARMDTGVLRV